MPVESIERPCPKCGEPVHIASWTCPYCEEKLRHTVVQRLAGFMATILAVMLAGAAILAGAFAWLVVRVVERVRSTQRATAESPTELAGTPVVHLDVFRAGSHLERSLPIVYQVDLRAGDETQLPAFLEKALEAFIPRDYLLFCLHHLGSVKPGRLAHLDAQGFHHEESYQLENPSRWPFNHLNLRIHRLYSKLFIRFPGISPYLVYLREMHETEQVEYAASLFCFTNRYTAIFGKLDFERLNMLEHYIAPRIMPEAWTVPSNYLDVHPDRELEDKAWCAERARELHSCTMVTFSHILASARITMFTGLLSPEQVSDAVTRLADDLGVELRLGDGYTRYKQSTSLNRSD